MAFCWMYIFCWWWLERVRDTQNCFGLSLTNTRVMIIQSQTNSSEIRAVNALKTFQVLTLWYPEIQHVYETPFNVTLYTRHILYNYLYSTIPCGLYTQTLTNTSDLDNNYFILFFTLVFTILYIKLYITKFHIYLTGSNKLEVDEYFCTRNVDFFIQT